MLTVPITSPPLTTPHFSVPACPQGVPAVLIVTGTSFMVLDPKSMALKYRVELQYLNQISLSCFGDRLMVMHINPVSYI